MCRLPRAFFCDFPLGVCAENINMLISVGWDVTAAQNAGVPSEKAKAVATEWIADDPNNPNAVLKRAINKARRLARRKKGSGKAGQQAQVQPEAKAKARGRGRGKGQGRGKGSRGVNIRIVKMNPSKDNGRGRGKNR